MNINSCCHIHNYKPLYGVHGFGHNNFFFQLVKLQFYQLVAPHSLQPHFVLIPHLHVLLKTTVSTNFIISSHMLAVFNFLSMWPPYLNGDRCHTCHLCYSGRCIDDEKKMSDFIMWTALLNLWCHKLIQCLQKWHISSIWSLDVVNVLLKKSKV